MHLYLVAYMKFMNACLMKSVIVRICAWVGAPRHLFECCRLSAYLRVCMCVVVFCCCDVANELFFILILIYFACQRMRYAPVLNSYTKKIIICIPKTKLFDCWPSTGRQIVALIHAPSAAVIVSSEAIMRPLIIGTLK